MSQKKFDRKILYNYIQEKYEINKLPKHFFIKMSNIFNGKLEGLLKPIPPEHMYDMWVRKSNYLDRIYMNNFNKGKKMDSYVRLNYDLAVLISKYEDYLSWLDKQKALSSENNNVKENITVTEVLYKQNDIKDTNNDKDNLSDILDDLI
jgi:hypothetical protein